MILLWYPIISHHSSSLPYRIASWQGFGKEPYEIDNQDRLSSLPIDANPSIPSNKNNNTSNNNNNNRNGDSQQSLAERFFGEESGEDDSSGDEYDLQIDWIKIDR